MNLTYLTTDNIIDAVYNINEAILDKSPLVSDVYNRLLTMSTDGMNCSVTFLGHQIWFSEDDEREYFEEKDEYEDLEGYLKKQCANIIQELHQLVEDGK